MAAEDKAKYPVEPWKLDTNNRYRDAVKIVIDLSTAALVIPIFFLKDILQIPKGRALVEVLNCKIYASWGCLAFAICLGFIFYYASGKWVRLAWGQTAGFFRTNMTEQTVEKVLDVSFFGSILFFLLGIGLTVWFVVTF